MGRRGFLAPESVQLLCLSICLLFCCASDAQFTCISKRTSSECSRVEGQKCEWIKSLQYCEPTCSSFTTSSTCRLLDKCDWMSTEQTCQRRESDCYRWDDRRGCEAQSSCVWQDEERSCVSSADIELEGSESEPCSQLFSESRCSLNGNCVWSIDACRPHSSLPGLPPSGAVATGAPTRPGGRCDASGSKQECESQSGDGVTCVFYENTCRIVVDRLIPSRADPVAGGVLIWAAVYSGFAGLLSVGIVLIRSLNGTCVARPKTIRVMQFIRCALAAVSLGFFAESEEGLPIITASLASSIMIVSAVCAFLGLFESRQLCKVDFVLFVWSFPVAASTTKTLLPFVFVGAILMGVGALLLPIEYGFRAEIKSESSSRLLLVLRILLIACSSVYVGVWAVLIDAIGIANLSIICMLVVIAIGLAAGTFDHFEVNKMFVNFLNMTALVAAVVGSMDANYAVTHFGLVLVTLAVVALSAMVVILNGSDKSSAKSSKPSTSTFRSSTKEAPRISPNKHKVFVQPPQDPALFHGKPSQANSNLHRPSARVPYVEPESLLGIVYFEQRSLDNSYNSQPAEPGEKRRRGSSADYKREMALV